MPKNSFRRKTNSKSKVSKSKSKSRSKSRSKSNRKKRGGFKAVLPMRYFNPTHTNHYYNTSMGNPNAVSHGVSNKNNTEAGPNLYPQNMQNGGGVLPAEYFGGNSGRYFEAGSPELVNCTNAYGRNITSSHGVVMDPPHNMWMGPNMATVPDFRDLTGGGKKKRRNKKCKKVKKSLKNKSRKIKSKKTKSKKTKSRRN
jgi:hypothetical protein